MKVMVSSWLVDSLVYEVWIASDKKYVQKIYYSDLAWPIGTILYFKQIHAVKSHLGITNENAERIETEVNGLAGFLAKPESETQEFPERSAINSSYAPRTTATRTRCSTRTRAVEGTDARKTPATRTTRKRASQEASIQKNMEAEFEAEKDQSELTTVCFLEISEVVSGVSVEIEGQSEPQKEVEQQVNDGQEVINLDAQEEVTEMSNDSKKVDFHSFSRRDLQNLCKRNKKPANTTNVAIAASLESLEIVEGLQELLMGCDSQVPSSPLMSKVPTIILRMDISHGSPRHSDVPSIAAVTFYTHPSSSFLKN